MRLRDSRNLKLSLLSRRVLQNDGWRRAGITVFGARIIWQVSTHLAHGSLWLVVVITLAVSWPLHRPCRARYIVRVVRVFCGSTPIWPPQRPCSHHRAQVVVTTWPRWSPPHCSCRGPDTAPVMGSTHVTFLAPGYSWTHHPPNHY